MLLSLVCLSVMKSSLQSAPSFPSLPDFDVIWKSPSEDAAGSMPIGNGQVVLNVWVEKSTGDLLFYIARTDSLSEISRYLKLGRIRVHLDGNPFRNAREFQQHLNLKDGVIELEANGVVVRLLVDSASDNILIIGNSAKPLTTKVTLESWRTEERPLPIDQKNSAWSVHDAPFPLVESADRFLPSGPHALSWSHRNETTIVPQLLENQSLTGLPGTFDPILHRTFGGRIEAEGFVPNGINALQQVTASSSFRIQIATHTQQTKSLGQWLSGLNRVASKGRSLDVESRTKAWWNHLWSQSWVLVQDTNEPKQGQSVSQGYILQRYVQACQGRGEYPIKFNGGYYTVEPKVMGKPFNADWRNWGDSHWFQNVRHMYHPMLASGDFDMMEPFFKLYENSRPLAESRTKKYHGAEGAYFPETMTVFGTYSGGDYGWDRTNHQPKDVDCQYWQYAWNQGPELLALMLDRWE